RAIASLIPAPPVRRRGSPRGWRPAYGRVWEASTAGGVDRRGADLLPAATPASDHRLPDAAAAGRREGGTRMDFKQFLHDDTGCASYFVASRESREAMVIDPQHHIQPYLDLAAERDYRIAMVIDTHLHADHISGNRTLASATGASLFLHADAEVDFPFRALHDGEEIPLGQLVLRVIHTPGHRPESISLVLTNPSRSPAPSMVLSGDTLFVGDVGRPDFGGPDGALAQ